TSAPAANSASRPARSIASPWFGHAACPIGCRVLRSHVGCESVRAALNVRPWMAFLVPRVSDLIPATPTPVPRRSRKIAWIMRGAWLAAIVVFCIVWPAWEYPAFDIEPQQRLKAFVQLVLLHGSWLLWPLLVQSGFKAWLRRREHRRGRAAGAIVLVIVCGVLCWARFVAPNRMVVRRTVIPAPIDLNIALVSDMHIGIFTRTGKLAQMVDKLNALHVDMVLIAGDLTYDPRYDLSAALAPLRHIDKPVYVVLGNHD